MKRLTTLAAAAVLSAAAAAAGEGESPLLSGPYVVGLGTEDATVCWQTPRENKGTVRFRAEGKAEWTAAAETEAAAFHAVRLEKLSAGTEYEARVLAGGQELAALAFRTAPEKADRFTFFVYGDTRSNPGAHEQVTTALLAEARRLKEHTFVLNMGDLASYGSDEEQTARQFFRPAAEMLRWLPIFPARGNHECGTRLFPRYFPAPPRAGPPEKGLTGDNYCFDYGSVRVVVLDQYAAGGEVQAQVKWLSERLAEAKDRWRFVAFHEPVYSNGGHGSNLRWRGAFEGALRAGKVHAVFSGHDHDYERTKPIGGVTYLVSGGGGAPLDFPRPLRPEWSVKFLPVLHFMTVTVSPEKLAVRVLQPGKEGGETKEIDSVEIPADCGWDAGPPPAEGSARDLPPAETVLTADDYRSAPNPWKLPVILASAALLAVALPAAIARRRKQRTAAAG